MTTRLRGGSSSTRTSASLSCSIRTHTASSPMPTTRRAAGPSPQPLPTSLVALSRKHFCSRTPLPRLQCRPSGVLPAPLRLPCLHSLFAHSWLKLLGFDHWFFAAYGFFAAVSRPSQYHCMRWSKFFPGHGPPTADPPRTPPKVLPDSDQIRSDQIASDQIGSDQIALPCRAAGGRQDRALAAPPRAPRPLRHRRANVL